MQSALETRILQLEAANADLSLAASEAAALAEEYAADAAAYRRGVSSASASDALVTELSDAARRKDRRIARLTALLSAEKKSTATLQARVDELAELNALADEMEDTLRKSLAALQRRLADPAPTATDIPTPGLHARAAAAAARSLVAYFPADAGVAGDVSAFDAMQAAVRVVQLANSLAAELSHAACGKHEDAFLSLAERIARVAEAAVRWCFDEPHLIPERGPPVESGLRALEERVRSLCADFAAPHDVRAWSDDFASMKLQLVSMALDTLAALVPDGFEGIVAADGIEGLIDDVVAAAEARAKEVAESLRRAREAERSDSNIAAELRSKLDATKSKLEHKTRELEDLSVRTSIFEERMSSTLDDTKEIAALRQKVLNLEADLAQAQGALAETCARNPPSETKEEKDLDEIQSNEGPSPLTRHYLDVMDDAKESARLRRILVHRHLVDLQTISPWTNVSEQLTFEKNREVHETVLTALDNAREAASNARVVRLDADTLQPNTRGATMSRKVLLQAIALANKHMPNVNKVSTSDSTQCHELKLNIANADVLSVASALRQSLSL